MCRSWWPVTSWSESPLSPLDYCKDLRSPVPAPALRSLLITATGACSAPHPTSPAQQPSRARTVAPLPTPRHSSLSMQGTLPPQGPRACMPFLPALTPTPQGAPVGASDTPFRKQPQQHWRWRLLAACLPTFHRGAGSVVPSTQGRAWSTAGSVNICWMRVPRCSRFELLLGLRGSAGPRGMTPGAQTLGADCPRGSLGATPSPPAPPRSPRTPY